jgi:hypothetical protein
MRSSDSKADKQFLSKLLEAPMTAEPNKSSVELATDFIKAIAWPLFALIFLISFWEPFQAAANMLPDIVNRSNTITIAGLTLQINRSLKLQNQQPSSEVKQVLADISPDDINKILATSGWRVWNAQEVDGGRDEYAKLVKLGVFREMTNQELQNRTEYAVRPVYGVVNKPLGDETRDFLIALIAEFAQQLGQPQQSPTP